MMSGAELWILFCYIHVGYLLAHLSGTTASDQSSVCKQTVCNRKREILRCPGAQILVTNTTSSSGENDDAMLRVVKRACMGKSSCDVSGMCQNRPTGSRIVSYFCARKLPEGKPCTGSAMKLPQTHGFLQNPDYPAAGRSSWCHWRIEPQSQQYVHLTIFDLTSAHRTQGRCDGGLHITAHGCGRNRQQFAEVVCANDSRTRWEMEGDAEDGKVTLVSCGPVDVRLTPARYAYPLRFWLGYSVKDTLRSEAPGTTLLNAGLLSRCVQPPAPSGREDDTTSSLVVSVATMTTAFNQSVTSASGGSDIDGTNQQTSTMTVLIVLVCVIGVIALILTVVLIVVCFKRRRPKLEMIEHVYAVPSTCQTLSHSYLDPDSTAPEPVSRARLIQAYSDVADAVPPDQSPLPNPSSPTYAEVEEICDVDTDEKTRKRFQFRFRKRPSVSSSGGSSLYEDVNPIPVNSANSSKHNNSASPKNNTVPRYNPASRKSGQSGGGGGGGGNFTTGGKRGGRGAVDGQSNKTARNNGSNSSSVYVHVVDSLDKGTDSKANPASRSRTVADKSTVAPLAAKFIANIDKDSERKVGPRRKTEASTTRLYPLQEGRVATLVSTLNRNKDSENGAAAREQAKVS